MKHQKTIEQNVFHFIEKNDLLVGAKKILIAFSGGADSVFAIYFFNRFKKKYGISISAVHVNHNLRGSESQRDEKFCKDLCKNLSIEFYSTDINVKSFAKENKKSLEEAARILRYRELNKFAKNLGAELIITAHNIDDNTESVLLNLISGTGLNGLAGIHVKRENIIRPFLCLAKSDIVHYLNNNNVEFVTDSSNENLDFRRNYIRHEIVPRLKEKINPSMDKVVLSSSVVIKSQLELINFFTLEISNKLIKTQYDEIIITIDELNNYPKEIWGEIFKIIFSNHLKVDFNYSQFEKLSKLIHSQVGTKIEIGNKLFAYRERAKIVIEKNVFEKFIETEIRINQSKKVYNKLLSIEQIDKIPEKLIKNSNIEYISGDTIKNNLLLRTWEMGDKIQLLGMDGTKKISDVLTDLKLPSYKRKKQLVLLNEKDIVWIVGKRISEQYKITSETKIKLKLCLK